MVGSLVEIPILRRFPRLSASGAGVGIGTAAIGARDGFGSS
jgi:hypothetical protein